MPENTVVVAPARYGALTVVSLTLNGVVLLLIFIGLICHHHRHHRGHFHGQGHWQDRGGDNGMRFHRGDFGNRPGGWDRNREGGPGGENGWNKGPEAPFQNAPGGPAHPGFGGPGGMHMQIPAVPDVTGHIMKHLTTQLALTDDQAKQIRPVVEQQAASLQKDMESQREFLAKSVEDTTAKIRPLLNADQQKKLDSIKSFVADKLNSAAPAK